MLISDINIDGTQSRCALNEATVEDYRQAIQGGAKFPPVTVFFDGSSYWLADGFHRYFAHAAIDGMLEIDADVRKGTQRDALLHSLGANAAHGLQRTNADKRRIVTLMLEDAEWAKWSDREIARACAVSAPFVGDVRGGLSVNRLQINKVTNDPESRTVKRGEAVFQQAVKVRSAANEPDDERDLSPIPAALKTPRLATVNGEDMDALRNEIAELRARVQTLTQERDYAVEELDSLSRILQADDSLAQAHKEIERFKAKARVAEERVNGLMREKNSAISMLKSAQRKLKEQGHAAA